MQNGQKRRLAATKKEFFEELSVEDKYDINAKLAEPRFHLGLVMEMRGTELTIEYLKKNGFSQPFLFRKKAGLGKSVVLVSSTFTLNSLRVNVNQVISC